MGSKEEVLQAISDPMKMLRYTSERYDSLKGFPRGKISIALGRAIECDGKVACSSTCGLGKVSNP